MNVVHYGNIGDIIYSLPSAVSLAKGERFRYYLEIDHPANYSAANKHPLGNVCLNREYAEKLLPLLTAQPYIEEARIWSGEPVDYNLSHFRLFGFPHSAGDIARYYRHLFPCQPRTWEPWLTVEPDPAYSGMILVNRTPRYRNPSLSYAFLAKYASRLAFIGLKEEYADWSKRYGIQCHWYLPNNFLEAARAIRACRLFIGNQSSCFALAEAMKVPRIVEVFAGAPNVIPNGEWGYEAIRQDVFERLVAEVV